MIAHARILRAKRHHETSLIDAKIKKKVPRCSRRAIDQVIDSVVILTESRRSLLEFLLFLAKKERKQKEKRHRMLKRTSDFSLLLDSSIHNHYRAYLTLYIAV